MKKFFTTVFLLTFLLTAFAQTDAKVEAVYTLGQIPAPLGVYQHKVSARIINTGTSFLSSLPVTLTVTGSNSYTDTKTIDIAPNDTTLIDFNSFSPWNQGTNTITVSVPADDDNTNNSAAYTQLVNDRIFNYADNSVPVTSAGFGSIGGIILTKYTVSGSAVVNRVKVHVGSQSFNEGNNIYAVVMQYGSVVATSLPHLITAADLDTDLDFDIINPPTIEIGEFMVGIGQNVNAVTAYYPIAVQDEGIKSRPAAYYACFPDGSGLSEVTLIGRPMISAEMSIGNISPFNAPTQPNYVIAAWDFTNINSPATAAATIVDTILQSSPLLTRGPAAGACPGNNAFFTTGFDDDGISTANNDYFQFTLTPKPGDTLSLREIDAFVGNNTAMQVPGVNSQFAYSTDGTNFTLIAFPLTNSTDGLGFYLGNIAALQNIPGGNTITFRYYASGPSASAEWGFLSTQPAKLGLSITGRSTYSNKVITDPVIPTGADFTLGDCFVSPVGSVSFTSTGNFSANNQYKVELGRMFQPAPNVYLFLDAVEVGSVNSNANAGTINFSIPPGTIPDYYTLRIKSTEPPVIGTYSQGFNIYAPQCHSQATDRFRSKASGNWADVTTWQSSSDGGSSWIDATLAPDDYSSQVEIAANHIVEVKTAASSNKTIVKGILKIINGNGNTGSFSISNHVFGTPNVKVDTAGTLQFVSNDGNLSDLLNHGGFIAVSGKISVGDGVTALAGGFEGIANGDYQFFWQNGSVFEWNSIAGIAPPGDITYFPDNFSTPTFKITNIPGGSFGGTGDLLVNGVLEVDCALTMTGSGTKTFRDGIKGTGQLTQTAGSGKFITNATFAAIPPTNNAVATMRGIIDGSVSINLSEEGMTLEGGATIPAGGTPLITGKVVALQTFETQFDGKVTINTDTLLLQDADLVNGGLINGSGSIQFKGSALSSFSSPGSLLVPLSLLDKQVQLGSNSFSSNISLLQESNLTLGQFNLNMGTADLIADSANFIISNDTGRLNRYVAATPVLFPLGINNNSYSPVIISNAGNADNIKVRVADGVQTDIPVTDGNVNRTWIVGDTAQAGIDLTMTMRWNETDEQAGFDRSHCHVSHYSSCALNCSTGYFDESTFNQALGTTSFTVERIGLTNFNYPSFIITSKPFVYTFTGNGNWEDANNWLFGLVAPAVIPEGTEVLIDPVAAGECLRNGNITVKQGGKFTVQPGKHMNVTGDLNIE